MLRSIGLVLSWLTNTGRGYATLRQLGLTQIGSWPTIWQSAFREFRNKLRGGERDTFPYRGQYIVVEFRDGRRLIGGLVAQSETQEDGHVILDNYYWANEKDANKRARPGAILIPAKDIAFVEFIPQNYLGAQSK